MSGVGNLCGSKCQFQVSVTIHCKYCNCLKLFALTIPMWSADTFAFLCKIHLSRLGLKNERFVCPFGLKIRRVGRSICFFVLFFFFCLFCFVLFFLFWTQKKMQCHPCMCILGYAEPQNLFKGGSMVNSPIFNIRFERFPKWQPTWMIYHHEAHDSYFLKMVVVSVWLPW